MKKFLSLLLTVLLMAGMLSGIPSVLADPEEPSSPDPVEDVNISIESYTPTSLVSGGDVSITILITNSGSAIDNAILSVAGQQVASYGTIAAGTTKNYSGVVAVTTEMLDKDIEVRLDYTFGGTSKSKIGTFKVAKKAADIKFSTVVKADKESITSGENVVFTFAIENKGNVPLEKGSIVDSNKELKKGEALSPAFTVNVGESKIVTYTAKITETTEVKPVFKYTADGKEYTKELEVLTITVTESTASVVVTTDIENPMKGEEVAFDIVITNTGNVNLTSLLLTDSMNRQIPLPDNKLAPGATMNVSYAAAFEEDHLYSFTLSCKDPASKELVFTSNVLNIEMAEEPPVDYTDVLSLIVAADTANYKKEGKVLFTFTLKNDSDVSFTDVKLMEQVLGQLQPKEGALTTLAAGQSLTFTYEQLLEQEGGMFYFKVVMVDEDGNTVSVSANTIEITASGQKGSGMSTLLLVVLIIVLLMLAAGVTLIILVKKDKLGQRPGITRKPPVTGVPRAAAQPRSSGAYESRPYAAPRAQQNVRPVGFTNIEEEDDFLDEEPETPPAKPASEPERPKRTPGKRPDFTDRNYF